MEIVAPAGNFNKLKTAILYGADAVYLAGQKYSLRAGADNFTPSELEQASQFCHKHNKKIYVTLNAYLHDKDFEGLFDYLKFLEKIKIDAVICADLGVVRLVKENSKIPVHLSTQAFVLNSWHAKIWKCLGVKRIVLGRELSIKQAAKIKREVGIEIELFIHGAMCMSYSGHCTISNYTAGRDSNRGGCIQSCRHIYNIQNNKNKILPEAKTLLSSKDLNGFVNLKDFVAQGLDAAKIEGRMKGELYLASTVRAYSHLLQEIERNKKSASAISTYLTIEGKEELKKLPHRGYTTASLKKKADKRSIYDGTAKNSKINQKRIFEFSGVIVFYDSKKQRVYLQTKNPLRQEMEVEILTPQKNIAFFIENLKNAKGDSILYSDSNRVVSFDCPNKATSKGYIQKHNFCLWQIGWVLRAGILLGKETAKIQTTKSKQLKIHKQLKVQKQLKGHKQQGRKP